MVQESRGSILPQELALWCQDLPVGEMVGIPVTHWVILWSTWLYSRPPPSSPFAKPCSLVLIIDSMSYLVALY